VLELAIGDGLAAMQNFGREAAQELVRVQEQLVDGIAIMADQHRATATMVQKVGLHNDDTAQRVTTCMMELQFNDTACQRIEHVRGAMAIVVDLARSGSEADVDALVGAVCRLQILQLKRTADDYRERVEALIANLHEIAKDAIRVCDEAKTSLKTRPNGGGGTDSFVGAIKKDMMVGAELLNRQKTGQEGIRGAVQSVLAGFAEMANDLDAIQSIDSDMRVMGLNASFKCSRLGSQGKALGVIATELRSCSKRTEEISGNVSQLLQSAIEMSKELGTQVGNDNSTVVSDLVAWLTNSSIDLGAVSAWLDETLERLGIESQRTASLLDGTADGIVVHHRMNEALSKAATQLESIADRIGVDGADIEVIGGRIRALLSGHYTMQSERLIHQIFADCFSDQPMIDATADNNVELF
jgi:hypothetical protein